MAAPPYSWKTTGRNDSPIVPEPTDNVFGPLKVLMRVDGLYAVHDSRAWPPSGPVFTTLAGARRWASVHASLPIAS